jgi:hypothetical protein
MRTVRALVRATAFFASLLAIGATALPARAEPHVDGKWRQSALREDFAVQQWLDAGCGPPPQSTSTGGGEVVSVRMEGDELTFVGGGRVYRTNQCYDPMPTLSRASHSRASDGKTWRTRCVTPPADPRKTVLNTLVVLTSDTHIDIVETGRYEITLENGRCMADVKRTRGFDLVSDDSATPSARPTPAATPAPKPADPPRSALCGTPLSGGEPAKLEVRPSKKLLRTGESFRFAAVVLDATGCPTKTATTWHMADPANGGRGVTVDATGNVTVAGDAAEGTVEVVATAAGKDARVVVEIASPSRYDELLARSGLNAAGEDDEAATAAIASQSLGAGEGRAEDRSRGRRFVFLAIIGAVLVILALAGMVVLRRSRRAKALLAEADERHEERVKEVLDRRQRREAEHAAQMRAHVESVRAHESARLAAAAAAAAADKEELPYPPRGPMARGKICPTCGERFDGAADFCGKDGTQLVLLN